VSDLPCFKCGATVQPKKATFTRDGGVACPNCTKKLGMRVEPRVGFQEVARMRDRQAIERMRDRVAQRAKDERASEPMGDDIQKHETIHDALEWVLGEKKDLKANEEATQ
jgi:uncharacterized Zn finger protein (UPF0148 family)